MSKQQDGDRLQGRYSKGLIGLFAGFLCLPGLAQILRVGADPTQVEQRTLSESPRLPGSWQEWQDLPDSTSAYVRDRFGLRVEMVRLFSLLNYSAGHSIDEKVAIGRSGWLFLNQRGSIAQHRGLRPLSDIEILGCRTYLEELNGYFQARNIPFFFAIAPNKASIYPEYMPAWANIVTHVSPADQVLEDLRRHTDIQTIDLESALVAEREGDLLYYSTDSHWNSLGAYVAYRAIALALQQTDSSLEFLSDRDVSSRSSAHSGDLARVLNLEGFLVEEAPSIELVDDIQQTWQLEKLAPILPSAPPSEFIRSQGLNDRSILLFRDSFANQLRPFIAATFNRTIYSHSNHGLVDLHLVETYQPDLAILEIVERAIPTFCQPRALERLHSVLADIEQPSRH